MSNISFGVLKSLFLRGGCLINYHNLSSAGGLYTGGIGYPFGYLRVVSV